jgi:hypothetical protein
VDDGGSGLPPREVIGTTVGGANCDNALDDDGDGVVNEDCPCTPGETASCYPGRPDEAGGTRCGFGRMTCSAARVWAACVGFGRPEMETCNGMDDNCDGFIDEGCSCPAEGMTRPCYGGPMGTPGVGVCRSGTQACQMEPGMGLRWGECNDMVVPAFESCNGHDDDCDGMTDEGCSCELGAVEDCYTGPAGSADRGMCRRGFRRCVERTDGGSTWTACYGMVLPLMAETCNGADDTCDGATDEGCPCTPGEMRPCYDGPSGTSGRGRCAAGRMVCGSDSRWGACTGQVLPGNELCNGVDDSCDGRVDESCICPMGQQAIYRLRPVSAAPMCGIQMGDGLPLMVQACEASRCPEGRVSAEVTPGRFQCVEPPPECPPGRHPTYRRDYAWVCDRGCEMVVRYGGIFGSRALCTPRPPAECAPGCFRVFRPELESWACSPRCAGGMQGILLAGQRLCLPCPNPPGIRIRTGD